MLGEERQELGSLHIPTSETRLIPGAFADPFRVVEVLPGVAPVLSGIPYFYVRGAPPGDVGYRIDNIPVPLLFHVGRRSLGDRAGAGRARGSVSGRLSRRTWPRRGRRDRRRNDGPQHRGARRGASAHLRRGRHDRAALRGRPRQRAARRSLRLHASHLVLGRAGLRPQLLGLPSAHCVSPQFDRHRVGVRVRRARSTDQQDDRSQAIRHAVSSPRLALGSPYGAEPRARGAHARDEPRAERPRGPHRIG